MIRHASLFAVLASAAACGGAEPPVLPPVHEIPVYPGPPSPAAPAGTSGGSAASPGVAAPPTGAGTAKPVAGGGEVYRGELPGDALGPLRAHARCEKDECALAKVVPD